MKKFFAILLISLLCGLVSCQKEQVISDYLSSVSTLSTDNALRYDIKVELESDCEFFIRYWKKGKTEGFLETRTYRVSRPYGLVRLKFLYPDCEYDYQIIIKSGNREIASETYSFKTNGLPAGVPSYTVIEDKMETELPGYILQWQASNPGVITFCDMSGKVVWYQKFDQAVRHVFFDKERGELAVLSGFKQGVGSKEFQRICDKIWLVNLNGDILIQTQAEQIGIPFPHHDIKITPEGNLIILNNIVKQFKGRNVYGEGFTIIDRNGRKIREWDIFEELGKGDFSYLEPDTFSYDLMHANSVNQDTNGDYYMTMNRYSELWKISGKSGEVQYRFGENGNLNLQGGNYPKGGLHSAVPIAADNILCYNNGGEQMSSKALLIEIDTVTNSAKYDLEVKLPKEYSSVDRSNVDILPQYSLLMFSNTVSRTCVFTDFNGNILKVIGREGISYRGHYFESPVL